MKTEFRFRVNGIVVPEIRIQRAMVNGKPVGDLQIAALDETIGLFALDDNSHLPDKDLPRFILEFRNETDWRQTERPPVLINRCCRLVSDQSLILPGRPSRRHRFPRLCWHPDLTTRQHFRLSRSSLPLRRYASFIPSM